MLVPGEDAHPTSAAEKMQGMMKDTDVPIVIMPGCSAGERCLFMHHDDI
jgi:hypothetical protein